MYFFKGGNDDHDRSQRFLINKYIKEIVQKIGRVFIINIQTC